MLNFLNLKSKPIHLFFWVASSLIMVCPVPPRNWSRLEAFEHALRGLKFFQDMRDSLLEEYVNLPPNDNEGLRHVGALLSLCRRKVREWDRLRRATNRSLKRELQN